MQCACAWVVCCAMCVCVCICMQVSSLSASTGFKTDGTKRVTLKALVAGEERAAVVDYSSDGFYIDGQYQNCIRKREENALLQLANGPERAADKRARQEEAARLRRALAPERARRKKLRVAEWRRRRQCGEPHMLITEVTVALTPIPTMCMWQMCMWQMCMCMWLANPNT